MTQEEKREMVGKLYLLTDLSFDQVQDLVTTLSQLTVDQLLTQKQELSLIEKIIATADPYKDMWRELATQNMRMFINKKFSALTEKGIDQLVSVFNTPPYEHTDGIQLPEDYLRESIGRQKYLGVQGGDSGIKFYAEHFGYYDTLINE